MSASPTADSAERQERTGLGNYFVSNYPPFSFWKPENKAAALEALNPAPKHDTPLGLYAPHHSPRNTRKLCYLGAHTEQKPSEHKT